MSCLFDSLSQLLRPELSRLKITDLRQTLVTWLKNNPNSLIAGTEIKEWLQMIQSVETQMIQSGEADLVSKSATNANSNDTNEYVQKMSRAHTWGGAPEIAVAANYFNVRITVIYRGRAVATFEPESKAPTSSLFLHWTGGHYTPIKRMSL
jgi:hypothetical protein